jgi:hypothetical protein
MVLLLGPGSTAVAEVEDIGQAAALPGDKGEQGPSGSGEPNPSLSRSGYDSPILNIDAFKFSARLLSSDEPTFIDKVPLMFVFRSVETTEYYRDRQSIQASLVNELKANYSKSTIEGSLFPIAVSDVLPFDVMFQAADTRIDDSGDTSMGTLGSWPAFVASPPWTFPLEPPNARRSEPSCSDDGSSSSVIRCQVIEAEAVFGSTEPGSSAEDTTQNSPAILNGAIGGLQLATLGGGPLSRSPPAIGGCSDSACTGVQPWVEGLLTPTSGFGGLGLTGVGSTPTSPSSGPVDGFPSPPSFGGGPLAASVPEPSPAALILVGLGGIALAYRKRRAFEIDARATG